MTKTIIQVSGMACSMCESHVNDAIRSAFSVDKVTSSHTKGETVVISKEPLDEKAIHAALDPNIRPILVLVASKQLSAFRLVVRMVLRMPSVA